MVAPGLAPPSPSPSRTSRDDRDRDRDLPAMPALKTLSPSHRSNSSSASVAPSPTPSIGSSSRPQLSLEMRAETRSIDSRSEKRLPSIPSLPSPVHERNGKGWALGAYDNKLVSTSLSQPPMLPPMSPGGLSVAGSQMSSSTSPHLHSGLGTSPSFSALHTPSPGLRTPNIMSMPSYTNVGGVLVLPDGTKLLNDARPDTGHSPMAHGGPNSPWSLLTVYVLPVFAGSPLKTPIEDLNLLCNQHIVGMSQRAPTSRLIAILTNDLRDFIASGMLTLKAKFEALEENKVVSRTAEVWNFFWGQILPYVEGVFLPLSQVRDVPLATSTPHQYTPIIAAPPIAVRQILLSAFLVHILLPLLPRLISLVTSPSVLSTDQKHRGATDLPRLLQMSLVLTTQARYTAFFPTRDFLDGEARNEETRDSVGELARAVRWGMAVASGAVELPEEEVLSVSVLSDPEWEGPTSTTTPARPTLQRGPSVSQAGRLRRRGPRSSLSQLEPEPMQMQRAPSGGNGMAPSSRWGRPRIDEDEDEAEYVPRAPAIAGAAGAAGATGAADAYGTTSQSTVRAAESFATVTERTPAAAPPVDTRRHARHERAMSSGESDLTTASSMFPRRKH